jgi:hypothetical protein
MPLGLIVAPVRTTLQRCHQTAYLRNSIVVVFQMLRDHMPTVATGEPRRPGPLKEIVEDLPQVDAHRARERDDDER